MDNGTSSIIANGILHDAEKTFTKQLDYVIKLLNGNPEFKRVLMQSEVDAADKKKLIDDVLKDHIDSQVYDLLIMLSASGRFHLIESIH